VAAILLVLVGFAALLAHVNKMKRKNWRYSDCQFSSTATAKEDDTR
jgi:hypothetical protein